MPKLHRRILSVSFRRGNRCTKPRCRMPRVWSISSWCARNGRPATGTSDFGIFSVMGLSRVASPPARIATGICERGYSRNDQFRSLEIKTEAHFLQAGLAHRVAQFRLVLARRTSESRRRPRRSILPPSAPLATPRSYHSLIFGLLMPPLRCFLRCQCTSISRANSCEIAAFERGLALQAEVFDEVQILDHGLVVRF